MCSAISRAEKPEQASLCAVGSTKRAESLISTEIRAEPREWKPAPWCILVPALGQDEQDVGFGQECELTSHEGRGPNRWAERFDESRKMMYHLTYRPRVNYDLRSFRRHAHHFDLDGHTGKETDRNGGAMRYQIAPAPPGGVRLACALAWSRYHMPSSTGKRLRLQPLLHCHPKCALAPECALAPQCAQVLAPIGTQFC
jgi:hypothetical protein